MAKMFVLSKMFDNFTTIMRYCIKAVGLKNYILILYAYEEIVL